MSESDEGARDPEETALYRDELDRLRLAAGQLRQAYHEHERELERARRRARQATDDYERLRARMSVRALLKAAEVARPLRGRRPRVAGVAGVAAPGAEAAEVDGWRPGPDGRVEVLGPEAYRATLLRRVLGEQAAGPLHVALAGQGAAALAESLTPAPWRLQPLARSADGRHDCPAGADVVIVCDPGVDVHALPANPVRVAVVGTDAARWTAQPWFDDLDIVLAADGAAVRTVAERSAKTAVGVSGAVIGDVVRAALQGWASATRFSLAVATPSREVAESWGDTHFGRALQRQLERLGHPARLYLRETYSSPDLVRSDVALHLAGLAAPRPQPGQVNVMWCISHPERLGEKRCEPYDLVLVASEGFAAELTPTVKPPVVPLAQATDPERFRPGGTGPPHDLLFVGNSRRTRRTIIDDLTPTRHDLAVYGGDWTPDLLDPRHLRGEVIPNAELHRYYSSARIVLNDHWPEMARLGFVSNRIYDALASGAVVISDPVEGLDRAFDGAVITYRGRDELRALVERYLADADARRELAERGRAAVLERHTFAHRAARILELVRPLLAARQLPPSAITRPAT